MPIRGHPFSWQIKKPRYGSRGLAVKNHCVAALGEVSLILPLCTLTVLGARSSLTVDGTCAAQFVGTTLFLLFALGCAKYA